MAVFKHLYTRKNAGQKPLPHIHFKHDNYPGNPVLPFFLNEDYHGRSKIWEQFEKVDFDPIDAVQAILKSYGLEHKNITRCTQGSLPVYNIDNRWILKLYFPILFEDHQIETRCLDILKGIKRIPVPEIIGAGTIDHWPFLIQSHLQGNHLHPDYEKLDLEKLTGIICDLAEIIRILHQLEFVELNSPLMRFDWQQYAKYQFNHCLKNQQSKGLSLAWLKALENFITENAGLILQEKVKPVLLHTELMDTCIFYQEQDGSFQLSGICDWAEAFFGPAEYELPSIVLFVTRTQSSLLKLFFKKYAYFPDALDETLQIKLMLNLLIHRYCNIPWFMELYPPVFKEPCFYRLARQWFAF
ncbi:phosphotransferase family protein [Candidatus Riflebacteria bacterium]